MSGVAANAGKSALKQGAKRDPELYILLAVMSGAFGLAGFYFGRKPTSATSEDRRINVAKNSMPWHDEAQQSSLSTTTSSSSSSSGSPREQFKYQYHPGGDARNPPKNAPSALHSVVVPNVNLPKELHEKYNKYGKEGF